MESLIIYELSTGRIVGMVVGETKEFVLQHNCPEGCSVLALTSIDIDHARQYVVDNEIVARPTFILAQNKTEIAANGVDILEVSGFPEGATLSLIGPVEDSWEADGTTQEITVNVSGTYSVVASKFPYQVQEIVINAS